ncbi:MAG: ferrous iron transport protein B [Paenibacillaceae bacterium]|nr:ferrous iron transport protein B [Paenibacillaceae bacterium]
MELKIALVGNPNCGKTTMFNYLTGSSQYVGNWPGVTVEKKEGKLKGHKEVRITDLPGIYSLSPYTLEEVVSRDYLVIEKPDAIINLVDGTNLERNLYLTTQVVELGIPVVLALNMIDLVQKNGDKIDTQKLGRAFGCEVVETSALKGNGAMLAAERAIELAQAKKETVVQHKYSKPVEDALQSIMAFIGDEVAASNRRWYAIKLFERDTKVLENLKLTQHIKDKLNLVVSKIEKELDDDSESIITSQRYDYIAALMDQCVQRKQKRMTASDKIDRIVTNRWLALPIFVVIMWGIYYVAITVGTKGTDWINDVLFGEVLSDAITNWMQTVNAAPWLQGLVISGILGGVGTVLGFLPQIFLLFLFIALLEDCGYMARIAFIMDRLFRKFGLSGKSFIPMLVASGCGVPGIMASRTIENERDRKLTIMMTTFIPCSAKLPIIALFAGALFQGSTWVAPSVYFMGIAMVVICGILLKGTKLFAGKAAPFVMELPQYHIPSLKGVLIHMWDRSKAFIKKAGTIVLVACCAIWFLQNFNWTMQEVEAGNSILADIGRVFAVLFSPLGFGNWQAAVATITGLVAKENVVATYGILFNISDAAENTPQLLTALGGLFTPASAYALIMFNMLCPPCFAAIATIYREMGSAKWMWITLGFQTLTAYLVALLVYQLGSALFFGGSVITALISIGIVTAVVACIRILLTGSKDQSTIK